MNDAPGIQQQLDAAGDVFLDEASEVGPRPGEHALTGALAERLLPGERGYRVQE